VVAAYTALIRRADSLRSGNIYNISSGRAVSMQHILDRLIQMSRLKISVEPDPLRQRPSDLHRIVGSADALARDIDWKPAFSLDQTLCETFSYFEGR